MLAGTTQTYSFAIVGSRFNFPYSDALVTSAQKGLEGHRVVVVRVPGAFEIPLQVQKLAKTGRFHVVIALGVVWQGETPHAAEILRACTDALMRIALETGVPVVHEVLYVRTEKEAHDRTMGELNRGLEAARTALELAALEEIHGKVELPQRFPLE
ncbi:6,7-dimethyl-8-ribityllumazine synthase [Candidatus Methylacidithermus pantelleriae]|uniref:6,7-dimethyl-8-ribityllumazine synthase n=1 Tax=Candidatus Methylacidithermus pantelleriae TaxID=2744239 RepID=A0A8J2BTL6_9BACT|nr:6,7-dimethyl-8-ribityllumazine synthase [Candidatus Methylacidithermus pantelleriae]CAF0698198.1 6,7-dimethyl-8-ribityllumazine synthase [Candidatus Methylacidithermus pantelleriae]